MVTALLGSSRVHNIMTGRFKFYHKGLAMCGVAHTSRLKLTNLYTSDNNDTPPVHVSLTASYNYSGLSNWPQIG